MSKQEKDNISKELDKLDAMLDKNVGKKEHSDLVFDERYHLKCEKGHVYTIEAGICNACKFGKHINND